MDNTEEYISSVIKWINPVNCPEQKLLWCAAGLAQQAPERAALCQSDGTCVQGVLKPSKQQLEMVGRKDS